MAQAVSHGPLTAEPLIALWSLCGICGGRSGNGTVFSASSYVFPFNIIPLWPSILICHLGDEQYDR
jgi:hypothetical protein